MNKILGISAFYHDSSVSIIINGKIIAAVQEERFTRLKNYSEFPYQSISYCLKEANISIDDIDAVVFYDKPFLKFERLLETYFTFAPKGLLSFLKSIPLWLNKKLFLKKTLRKALKELGSKNPKNIQLLFTEHHLSHAASAFYTSPFEESAILTIDGVGEWTTASICVGDNNGIKMIKELDFPHSIGLFYSAATYFLGFKVNSGEYKLMGLAPYGNPNDEQTLHFEQLLLEKVIHIYDDGSIWLDQQYFSYTTSLRMISDKIWEELLGFSKRKEEGSLEQVHANLALAIQHITEMVVVKMAQEAKRLTNSKNLCLAGGVALNCVVNGKLERGEYFENIWIQPAASDAGGSLGAALAIDQMYYKNKRVISDLDSMQGTYLGPSFSSCQIEKLNKRFNTVSKKLNTEDLTKTTAMYLAESKVIGWFQDRMEFGPRALGNRSILADPTAFEMQKKVNLKIKKREAFRPFAPAILEEDAAKYFDIKKKPSPYMLKVATLKKEHRFNLSDRYYNNSLLERLYIKRSKIQATTHVDFSSRVQTVNKKQNEKFWNLLSELGIEKTDKIVCLHLRDSDYLTNKYPRHDFSYHDYRDTKIESYCLAIRYLIEQGYKVVRIGAKSNQSLSSKNLTNYFDFCIERNEQYGDFIDVFLLSVCDFFIATNSGPSSVAAIFDTPTLTVNSVPISPGFGQNSRFIP
ncbi:carbamoyltransferase N-terminal domain-containing protein, partial [Nonlabens dokdonensis]|uniref:carbamoyltransferase N-terminal domain-containing protein n=1 Tax=Nonlabens dokdonensis TaxID=328515 RepID=UPI0026F306C0